MGEWRKRSARSHSHAEAKLEPGAGTWGCLTMNHTSTTWSPWQGGHQLHQLLPAEGARCLEVPDKKPGLTPAGTLGAAWNWRSQSCPEVAKAWPRGTVEESERGRVAKDGTLQNCQCQVPFYLAHTSPSEVPPGPQAVQNASPPPPTPPPAMPPSCPLAISS